MNNSEEIKKLRYFYFSGKLQVKNIREFKRTKERNAEVYQTMLSAFIFPISGRASVLLNNHEFHAEAGRVIYATSGYKIKFEVPDDTPFHYFNIYHNDVFDKNFSIQPDAYEAFIDDFKTYCSLTAAAQSELREYFIRERFISSLFGKLFEVDTFTDFYQFRIIEKTEHYLAENFHEDICLNDIARVLQVSANTLSYLYKKYRNETIKNRIIELRLKKAIDLIAHNHYSIKEAAIEVGFSDPLYFSRLFKSKIGYTPNELKNHSKV